MKKNIFKKVVATLATVAMAAGMLMNPSAVKEVKAEGSTLYAYGTFNNWSGEDVLTSTDGVIYTGEFTFNSAEDGIYLEATQNDWEGREQIASVTVDTIDDSNKYWVYDYKAGVTFDDSTFGTYTVTYNSSTKELALELKEISTVTYTYAYYVAGETTFEAESWSNNDPNSYGTKGKMTANGTTHTYTATTSADFDGTDGYNIIKIGTPDDSSAKTIEWLKNGDTAFACNYTGKGTLTVTFDSEAGTSTCTFVADKTTDTTDPTDSTDSTSSTTANNDDEKGETTTTVVTDGDNNTTVTDVTVEVILDESVAWEKVYIYAYNWDEATDVTTEYSAKWPGTEMTLKDGKWYATINATASTVSYVITNGTEQSWDIKDVKPSNGKVSLTMSGTKDAYGKYEASVTQVKTGDFSSVAMFVAVAALAAVAVVVMKKKAVNQ